MKNQIGQLMFIGISGHRLTDSEKKFIIEEDIGGIVLFSRNVSTPEQVHTLCTEIQSLRHLTKSKAPFFIAIDMEGGRVARLKAPFTVWPPLKHLGDADSLTLSFNFAKAMGDELRSVGINLDFAPCADTFTNSLNTVIGDRAVSTQPEVVSRHVSALIEGYRRAKVVSCSKHFPGHGNTIIDSHEDLPVENADLARLESVELKPFMQSFVSNVPMVMTAHISFPQVDASWPVTLSEIFLKKLARDKYHYQGLIITDDLDMKAMAKHYDAKKIPVRSLQAGADILLYCNEPDSPPKALEAVREALANKQISEENLILSLKRVEKIKQEYLQSPDPMPLDLALKTVGQAEHHQLAQAMKIGRVPEGLELFS